MITYTDKANESSIGGLWGKRVLLQFHFEFTSISLDFIPISLRSHFGVISISLRSHFDLPWAPSISLQRHSDLTLIPLPLHFEFTSTSL